MVSFFESINPVYCFILGIILFFIFIANIFYFKKSKNTQFLFIGLISFGLFYDTFVTGLGYVIQDLSAFYIIGMMRHVCHGLLTPLMFILVFQIFNDCGKLLDKKYKYITYTVVAVLCVWAIVAVFTSPVNVIDYAGVIRHSIDKYNAFFMNAFILKFLSYGTLIPMGFGSYIAIKEKKDFNILIATILMLVFTFVGVIFESSLTFLTSFVGEVFLVGFFFKYSFDQYRKEKV